MRADFIAARPSRYHFPVHGNFHDNGDTEKQAVWTRKNFPRDKPRRILPVMASTGEIYPSAYVTCVSWHYYGRVAKWPDSKLYHSTPPWPWFVAKLYHGEGVKYLVWFGRFRHWHRISSLRCETDCIIQWLFWSRKYFWFFFINKYKYQ